MSELTREQIEAQKRYLPSLEPLCDMALRTHDAEQEAAHWKRETEREAERANEWEKEAGKMVHHAFRHQDRADRAEGEAASLRKAAQEALDAVRLGQNSRFTEACTQLRELLQSAPPASESEKCPHCSRPLLPVDNVPYCEHCDYLSTDPAPADRPEPSEALEETDFNEQLREVDDAFDAALGEPCHCGKMDGELSCPRCDSMSVAREKLYSLSQPAPAVPDAVRQLPSRWRNRVEQYEAYESEVAANQRGTFRQCADDLERALATHPADGDSPAVPDGYVLVPKEPTDSMKIAGIDVSPMHREYYLGTFSSKGRRASLDTDQCDEIYRAMIAAAPTHPADGDSPAVPEYVRQRLWKIHSVLDRALGDTDCDWFETDDEMREEVPVQWAAKEIAHLAAAPTPTDGEK